MSIKFDTEIHKDGSKYQYHIDIFTDNVQLFKEINRMCDNQALLEGGCEPNYNLTDITERLKCNASANIIDTSGSKPVDMNKYYGYVSVNDLMEFCRNTVGGKINCNDIARFPKADVIKGELDSDEAN
jgi:hypothetical protein